MLKKTIVHAREYSYPRIDLPREIQDRYRVVVADTPSAAIRLVHSELIVDAYVLGMTMPVAGYSAEDIDHISRRREEFRPNGAQGAAGFLRGGDLSEMLIRRLDVRGGLSIYEAIRSAGKDVPILFWGSAVGERMGGHFPWKDKDVSILTMPSSDRELISWFDKHASIVVGV